MFIKIQKDHVKHIGSTIYIDFEEKYNDPAYLMKRNIITSTNEVVDKINMHLLSLLNGKQKIYLNPDTMCRTSMDNGIENILYHVEF